MSLASPEKRRTPRAAATALLLLALPVGAIATVFIATTLIAALAGLVALALALFASAYIAVRVFGRDRVFAFLERRGISAYFLRKDPAPKDKTGQPIEDAVVLEETPPPSRS